ncbi:hypothetical protein [Staphylococcus capitis]|uniref:hypothetical protein n=1 Tax=Staphylococcus capitis TaxID=29388 RepID=UPI001BD19F02|nr:hypothetical protein [Staphylococcus capitis]DAY15404.1 MAG TPA: hypothetical protein [Caudoviricetes sp.]
MEKSLVENLIENAYLNAKENRTLLIEDISFQLDTHERELLDGFHPQEVLKVTKDDAYYCGSRANTFVVMFGWDEMSGYEKTVLIHSNHKGCLHYTMFPY